VTSIQLQAVRYSFGFGRSSPANTQTSDRRRYRRALLGPWNNVRMQTPHSPLSPTARFAPALIVVIASVSTAAGTTGRDTLGWFQKTEQSLMDAVAVGDKATWDRVMDPGCVVTSEEGRVTPKKQFLDELRPLPPGLKGAIAVRDLTVQEFPAFAVVRFVADEWVSVFGQRLTTQYRVTDTFQRVRRTWRMVGSHVSIITRDPPAQNVATEAWPGFVGTYQLLPDGWKLYVVLRDGKLYGGRDQARLRPFIPLTPDAFVLEGTLGEWLFVADVDGNGTRVVQFRKFAPLVWTRITAP
jgi:hypothetical protein